MVKDNFVFVTDWTNDALQQISLEDGNTRAFKTEGNEQVMGVFYDSITESVIWSIRRSPIIYSSQLDETDFEELANLGKNTRRCLIKPCKKSASQRASIFI